jgi:hypothetical protein
MIMMVRIPDATNKQLEMIQHCGFYVPLKFKRAIVTRETYRRGGRRATAGWAVGGRVNHDFKLRVGFKWWSGVGLGVSSRFPSIHSVSGTVSSGRVGRPRVRGTGTYHGCKGTHVRYRSMPILSKPLFERPWLPRSHLSRTLAVPLRGE